MTPLETNALTDVKPQVIDHEKIGDSQPPYQDPFPVRKIGIYVTSALMLLGLYLSSLYNYLLFHTLVEMFSIVVGCGIFIISWNSRRILDNNYLLFLGIAFLFIAFLDLIHTLAYKGMPIFQGYDADLPTQLWIAAPVYGGSDPSYGPDLFVPETEARPHVRHLCHDDGDHPGYPLRMAHIPLVLC